MRTNEEIRLAAAGVAEEAERRQIDTVKVYSKKELQAYAKQRGVKVAKEAQTDLEWFVKVRETTDPRHRRTVRYGERK